uniref:ATP synthase F0 subunit 8 n=1 Tax=Parascaphoidella transversa TaxID=2914186 RepID=UPI001EDDBAF2|nr:ATP synthase F0 subunit 8 [Parascaphoidella transversa]UKE80329.1 ATP synthase F0 subunit 8 [Parascaphoidella transversa]
MPQMAPTWWTLLMLITMMMLMLSITMNYFTYKTPMKTEAYFTIKKLNWKW